MYRLYLYHYHLHLYDVFIFTFLTRMSITDDAVFSEDALLSDDAILSEYLKIRNGAEFADMSGSEKFKVINKIEEVQQRIKLKTGNSNSMVVNVSRLGQLNVTHNQQG